MNVSSMTYKVDFHTHSVASPDGALQASQYRQMLAAKRLDCIAVTDHNTIAFAKKLQQELGDAIIVGEEITTQDGEIIGLYLQKRVPPFLTVAETVARIKQQDGIVYIPHPFETVRKGMALHALDIIAEDVDIIEAYNGRAVFQNRTQEALLWASQHGVAVAASSDSHGIVGWGRTYTLLEAKPTRATLVDLLQSAQYHRSFPGVYGMMYPKMNRLRKWKWDA